MFAAPGPPPWSARPAPTREQTRQRKRQPRQCQRRSLRAIRSTRCMSMVDSMLGILCRFVFVRHTAAAAASSLCAGCIAELLLQARQPNMRDKCGRILGLRRARQDSPRASVRQVRIALGRDQHARAVVEGHARRPCPSPRPRCNSGWRIQIGPALAAAIETASTVHSSAGGGLAALPAYMFVPPSRNPLLPSRCRPATAQPWLHPLCRVAMRSACALSVPPPAMPGACA